MKTKTTSTPSTSKKATAKPTRSSRKTGSDAVSENLPDVSKQTAGGIVGATLGSLVAGPVGAVVGGVAGAMVGNASAEGQRPIETAMESIRSIAEKPIRQTVKRVAKTIANKAAAAKSAMTKATGKATKSVEKLAKHKGRTPPRGSTKAASARR